MAFEWIRFFITAGLLLFGLCAFAASVLGVYRFGFIMNRIHAAGIGDSLGLLTVSMAMMVSMGLSMDTIKMLLILVFMWFTSPVSTHFLSQVEYFTNPDLYRYVSRRLPGDEEEENRCDCKKEASKWN